MNAKLYDARGLARSPVSSTASPTGSLTLEDRTLWPRAGLKGGGATALMTAVGVALPGVNAAARQADGALLARLAESEYLALAAASEAPALPGGIPDFALGEDNAPDLCPVPRFAANAWFSLSGTSAAEMLAKLCSVDLRPRAFANGAVAQTFVARTTAIVIRDDDGPMLRFHLLLDWATADYFWRAVVDAMEEFAGPADALPANRATPGGTF